MSYDPDDYKEIAGTKIFKGIAHGDGGVFAKLDDKVYFFYEDPDDGYRSHCLFRGEALLESYNGLPFNLEHTPLEVDVIVVDGSYVGIEIYGSEGTKSRTDEPICRLGTENTDDYYPYCISEFRAELATEVRQKQFAYLTEVFLLDKEEEQ